MAKFAVLFFAALAFQAAFAYPYQHQNHQLHGSDVQHLLSEIQIVSRQAAGAIQNIESKEHSHILYSQANEFAHYVHEIVYHLQHAIHHGEQAHSQEVLEHAVKTLSEVVHAIEQAIHHEPRELKAEFVVQIQHVVTEAQKLAQVIQQEESDSHHIGEEVQEALDDILAAIQQLQIRYHIEIGSQQEVKNHIQSVTNRVISTIHGVSADSEDDVENLVHYAHHYGHHLGDIVHKLQKGARSHNIHDEQVRNVLEQVSSNLGQIHSSLEHIDYQSQGIYGQIDDSHHSQDYGRIGGSLVHTDRHSQDYGRTSGSLGHIDYHSQDYGRTSGSLGHIDYHSQDYGRIGGSLGHIDHHTQDYGRVGGPLGRADYHSQNYGPIGGSLEHIDHHTQDYGRLGGRVAQHSQEGFGPAVGSYEHVVLGHEYQKSFGPIGGPYDQVGHHIQGSYGNLLNQIRQVVQVLESSVRGVAAQLQRLVQLAQSSSIKQEEQHKVSDLIHSVIAHSLVATRQLERQANHTIHHGNNVNHLDYVNQEI